MRRRLDREFSKTAERGYNYRGGWLLLLLLLRLERGVGFCFEVRFSGGVGLLWFLNSFVGGSLFFGGLRTYITYLLGCILGIAYGVFCGLADDAIFERADRMRADGEVDEGLGMVRRFLNGRLIGE